MVSDEFRFRFGFGFVVLCDGGRLLVFVGFCLFVVCSVVCRLVDRGLVFISILVSCWGLRLKMKKFTFWIFRSLEKTVRGVFFGFDTFEVVGMGLKKIYELMELGVDGRLGSWDGIFFVVVLGIFLE